MQANWSLVLNVLLLIVVIIAIGRMMKARLKSSKVVSPPPSLGQANTPSYDDIIAVRKVKREVPVVPPVIQSISAVPEVKVVPVINARPVINVMPVINEAQARKVAPTINVAAAPPPPKPVVKQEPASSLMMFLLAKENRQLAGYELLQTVLAAGLRFGEGHLFHRHQHPNGQGPVLCSLAAATASGVFDLQNIGAFSVHGLCLFMHASGNPTIDAERFAIMLDTAKQLSEGLDTHLLDDQRQPLTDVSVQRYYSLLKLNEVSESNGVV